MSKYLKISLFSLMVFIGCENAEEPEPTGTLGIKISSPVLFYFNDWWDYTSKYEIYVDEQLKSESSFLAL